MKINGSMLVVVALMVGSLGATGCKSNAQSTEGIAEEQSVADAPVAADGTAGFEQDSLRVRFYAPTAPPAARNETPGRAPSDRHFWVNGYWRWNGREHVWVGGRWEVRRERHEYVGPRWQNTRNRWEYVPGHWVRR